MVNPSTSDEDLSCWIMVRVTSGRSCSMAPSTDATTAMVSRRAPILFWSIRATDSRWIVTSIEAPNPMISTTTMSSPILIASRAWTIDGPQRFAASRYASSAPDQSFRRAIADARTRRMADPTMTTIRDYDPAVRSPRGRRQRLYGLLEFSSDGPTRQLRGVRGDEPLLSALPPRDAGA